MKYKDSLYYDLADYYWLYSAKKDYPAESKFISDLIKKNFPSARTILDVGCGEGDHLNELRKYGYHCFGIDQSQKQIDKAKNKYPDISFNKANPLKDKIPGKYDAILVLWNTILYFSPPKNVKNVIKKLKKHLNPGGVFIFDFRSFYNHIKKKDFKKNLTRQIFKGDFEMVLETKNNINLKRKTITEITNSRIYKNNYLVKKFQHNPIELNILNLKDLSRILKDLNFKEMQIFDASRLYQNRDKIVDADTDSYLVLSKLP